MSHDPGCIFCRIVLGQVPSRKAYEDDEMLAFHDIAPWAPVHLLLIPKEHVPSMVEMEARHASLLGRMMMLAPRLMREHGVVDGFRLQVNTGVDGRQEVPHMHLHAMGGPRPWTRG